MEEIKYRTKSQRNTIVNYLSSRINTPELVLVKKSPIVKNTEQIL